MTVVIFYRIRDIRASKAPKITASMEYDEWRMLTIENLKPPKVQLCRSLDDLAGRSREYTQADLPPLLPGKTGRFNIRFDYHMHVLRSQDHASWIKLTIQKSYMKIHLDYVSTGLPLVTL